jgi:hypothetical protein
MRHSRRLTTMITRVAVALACSPLRPAVGQRAAARHVPLPDDSAVARYLRTHFAEPAPTLPAARDARARGRPALRAARFYLWRVEPVDFGGLLRRRRVFQACADSVELEWRILPSRTSCGWFGTDGARIWPLAPGGRATAIGALLRADQIRPERVNADSLAAFFAALDPAIDGHSVPQVLRPTADVLAYERPVRADEGGGASAGPARRTGYVVDRGELPKYAGVVRRPRVTGDAARGWVVEYYALGGWMHMKTAVIRHQVRVSPRYAVSYAADTLTRRAFTAVPAVFY